MTIYQLSDVFNEARVPVLTFVPPKEFNDLVGSLRTEGKHIVLSGPSGSGKTTLAEKALDKAKMGAGRYTWISGKDYMTQCTIIEFISSAFGCEPTEADTITYLKIAGVLVVDDFHHLLETLRSEIVDSMKRWSEIGIRLMIIGIAGVNKPLLDADPELAIRNDPYEIRHQDGAFIEEVLRRGEQALNFSFDPDTRAQFVRASLGIPSAIQLIARVACTRAEIFETADTPRILKMSMLEIKDAVLRTYRAKYQNRLIGMAKGKQQARSVHNTYFEIVKQICTLEQSEIPTAELYRRIVQIETDPAERSKKSTSFYNCINNLSDVIEQRGLGDAIYYDRKSQVISIEDPSFRIYLTITDISEIERSVRVRKSRYHWDVALSFAGEDRVIVEQFRGLLNNAGYVVYYDFDEQHKLWGENLRRKLREVYANDAQYMVVFLSKSYPEKDWTIF
jgi:hypothetical protein